MESQDSLARHRTKDKKTHGNASPHNTMYQELRESPGHVRSVVSHRLVEQSGKRSKYSRQRDDCPNSCH